MTEREREKKAEVLSGTRKRWRERQKLSEKHMKVGRKGGKEEADPRRASFQVKVVGVGKGTGAKAWEQRPGSSSSFCRSVSHCHAALWFCPLTLTI